MKNNINNNKGMIGLDCYDEILDIYGRNKRNKNEFRNQIFLSIKRIMEGYSVNKSNLEVKNSLILVLNLFLEESPDYLAKIGKNTKELVERDRNILNNILLSEIRA